MTEQWQELKETITEMRDNDGTGTQQEVCKFLANYMETLEKQMQQPSEDCISREEVRKILANQRDELVKLHTVNPKDNPKADAMAYGVNWSLNTLMELPSVIPKTRWIPCSEKMPDINIHVLAQFVMGGMAECYYSHNWWHIVGGFRINGDEVIAWMPLPQSYKESDNNESL